MSCGTCAKVRAHMPQAIRRRLEILERRMAEKKQRRQSVAVTYTVGGKPAGSGHGR